MNESRIRCLALAAAAALSVGRAYASSDYPTVVKNKLGLAQAPDCVLCHTDDNGGNGTVTTWFGLSMLDYGVQGKRPDQLDAALDRDRDDELDSDGDGIPDVDELLTGTNPNDGPGKSGGAPRPEHGCSTARTGGALQSTPAFFAWAAALATLVIKRAGACSRSRRGRASRRYPA